MKWCGNEAHSNMIFLSTTWKRRTEHQHQQQIPLNCNFYWLFSIFRPFLHIRRHTHAHASSSSTFSHSPIKPSASMDIPFFFYCVHSVSAESCSPNSISHKLRLLSKWLWQQFEFKDVRTISYRIFFGKSRRFFSLFGPANNQFAIPKWRKKFSVLLQRGEFFNSFAPLPCMKISVAIRND